MSLHSIRNLEVLSPIFVDPWSQKIRSPNCSALNPLARDLSGLCFVEIHLEMNVHSQEHDSPVNTMEHLCPLRFDFG